MQTRRRADQNGHGRTLEEGPAPWAGALLLGCLLLGALAYWAPWVDHRAAALVLSGQDLGEFVKFIPEIRRGQMSFPRQLFYLPPLACALSLALLAANRHVPWPHWLRPRGVRALWLLLALLLLPGLLPPAWGHPRELFDGEFRLQGIALLLGGAAVLAHGLFRRIPLPVLALILVLLALAGLVPAQWAFWSLRPRIWDAYGTPTVHLGWGLWLDLLFWQARGRVPRLSRQRKQKGCVQDAENGRSSPAALDKNGQTGHSGP
jgi:hypothetical protein